MDKKFREMIEEAEKIRQTSEDLERHARMMSAIIDYGLAQGLLKDGEPLNESNEEALALSAEMAAYIVGVLHKIEFVGSVLGMPLERKRQIMAKADELRKKDLELAEIIR